MLDKLLDSVTQIVIALIASFVVIMTYLDKRKKKRKEDNKHITVFNKTETMLKGIQKANDIQSISENIVQYTVFDRFLILTGTNGKTDFNYSTAEYEHHKPTRYSILSLGATRKYKSFNFDSYYREMLKLVEKVGFIEIKTTELPPCDLKDIYESEGIQYAIIFFLYRGKIDEVSDRLFYCSVATHEGTNSTTREKIIVKAQIAILRNVFETW